MYWPWHEFLVLNLYSSALFQTETFNALSHCLEYLCFSWQDINCTSLLCYNACVQYTFMVCLVFLQIIAEHFLYLKWNVKWKIKCIYSATDSRHCLNYFIQWILSSMALLCWTGKVTGDRRKKNCIICKECCFFSMFLSCSLLVSTTCTTWLCYGYLFI